LGHDPDQVMVIETCRTPFYRNPGPLQTNRDQRYPAKGAKKATFDLVLIPAK
jgi:hypothetical protein